MPLESDFQQLTQKLKAWNGRRRLRDGLIWVPRGLLTGLMAALLLAILARFRPLLTNQEVAAAALVLGLLGLLAAAVWQLSKHYSLPEQALFADRQFHLQERTTTAVEIHDGLVQTSPIMARQQLADTVSVIHKVDTHSLLPFTFARQDWLLILVAIILLSIGVVLPNLQENALLTQRAIDKSVAEQVEQLEALSQEILDNPDLTDAQKEELLEPITEAIEGLGDGALSQEQAIATLSETEAELRDLAAANDNSQLRQQLAAAASPLVENSTAQSLGEALQNGRLSEAGAAAAELADQLPNLTQSEQEELAQDLMETAQSLVGTDDQLAQELAAAAQALQNGDVEAAQQALQEAAGTLQERAQEAAAAQQAEGAANSLAEGRQAVAQAGQEPGQSGNPDNLLPENDGLAGPNESAGANPQPGPGQGEGLGQGQGQEPGQGQGNGGEGGNEGNLSGQPGGPNEGGGHVENVFVPEYQDLSGFEGQEIELPAECLTNPADCGALLNETPTEFGEEASIVPYTQVFGDYQDAANEALQEDYIPLGLKGYIRDYFSSLEP